MTESEFHKFTVAVGVKETKTGNVEKAMVVVIKKCKDIASRKRKRERGERGVGSFEREDGGGGGEIVTTVKSNSITRADLLAFFKDTAEEKPHSVANNLRCLGLGRFVNCLGRFY